MDLGYEGESSMPNKTSKEKPSVGPKITFDKSKALIQKGKTKVVPDAWKFHALHSKASVLTCFYCGLKGHMKFECKKRLTIGNIINFNFTREKSKKEKLRKRSCWRKLSS